MNRLKIVLQFKLTGDIYRYIFPKGNVYQSGKLDIIRDRIKDFKGTNEVLLLNVIKCNNLVYTSFSFLFFQIWKIIKKSLTFEINIFATSFLQ